MKRRHILHVILFYLLTVSIASLCGAVQKLLVLDLENKTFDAEKEWVGIGISYLVREEISFFKEFDVLPDRKMKPNPVQGEYDYVISGIVDYVDDKYTIGLELTKGSAGGQRKQFLTEGKIKDLFRIADYFVSRLASYLSVPSYDPKALKAYWKGGTDSVEAFENFIKAVHERRVSKKMDFYQAAIAKDDRFALAHLHLAIIYIYTSRHKLAQEELDKAIALMPDSPEAYNNLGYVRAQLGDFSGAENAFKDALRYDPDSVKYYLNLGDVLKQMKEYTQAEQAYRKAQSLEPKSPEIAKALDDLTWTVQHPEIVAQLGKSEKPLSGDTAGESAGRGVLEQTGGEAAAQAQVKPEETKARKEKVAEVAPTKKAEAGPASKTKEEEKKAKAKREAKKPEEKKAKEQPAAIAAASSSQDILEARKELDRVKPGDRAASEGFLNEAEKAFSEGKQGASRYNLGLFYSTVSKNYLAMTYLKEAVSLEPDNPDYHTALGNAYLKINKKKDAKKEFSLSKGEGSEGK